LVQTYPPPLLDPAAVNATFRADVETFGCSLPASRKMEILEKFSCLRGVTGTPDLKNPEIEVVILADYSAHIQYGDLSKVNKRVRKAERKRRRIAEAEARAKAKAAAENGGDGAGEGAGDNNGDGQSAGAAAATSTSTSTSTSTTTTPAAATPATPAEFEPHNVFIGRVVARGDYSHWKKYSLSTRPFRGTTSMAPEFALLMAHQGLVGPGSFVLDPFVATGSILVSCASLGAIVVGADRDPKR
jgi:hypothetical protein